MDLALSAAERRRLRATMRKAVTARFYRRLQAVLLVGEGRSTKEVAAIPRRQPAQRAALVPNLAPFGRAPSARAGADRKAAPGSAARREGFEPPAVAGRGEPKTR